MKVLVSGFGLMGKKVAAAVRNDPTLELAGVASIVFDEEIKEPMYKCVKDCKEDVDVIIDFSHPDNVKDTLEYCLENNVKLVLATTGLKEEQLAAIKEASEKIAIFQAYNTSFGVAMLMKILSNAAKELYDNGFDIEILEKHHNQKIDAPSGTAKLLYETMSEENPELTPVYDRSSLHQKRERNEVGIQAMRGGTIFGEHTVMFAGKDEIVEIKHTALSKEVFVQGAIAAAKALESKDAGLYNLRTLY